MQSAICVWASNKGEEVIGIVMREGGALWGVRTPCKALAEHTNPVQFLYVIGHIFKF